MSKKHPAFAPDSIMQTTFRKRLHTIADGDEDTCRLISMAEDPSAVFVNYVNWRWWNRLLPWNWGRKMNARLLKKFLLQSTNT